MSFNGSGRFQQLRRDSDAASALSSQTSIHSNFSIQAQQQQQLPEPGTGAAFMAQQGWSQRDAHGRPLRSAGATGNGATSAPRISTIERPGVMLATGGRPSTGILASGIGAAGLGVGRGLNDGLRSGAAPLPPHRISFNRERSRKTIYLISLIVVSLCLLLCLLLLLVLFATKTLVLNREPVIKLPVQGATGDTGAVGGSPSAINENQLRPALAGGHEPLYPHIPPVYPPPYSSLQPQSSGLPPPPPPALLPHPPSSVPPPEPAAPPNMVEPITDHYENRVFECEFYVKDQANIAYSDEASFEYAQATQILLNSLGKMVKDSTLRDMSPRLQVIKLENSGHDLRVVFQLSIMTLSRSTTRAEAIRNVLMSERGLLENLINHTKVDRMRIAVKMLLLPPNS